MADSSAPALSASPKDISPCGIVSKGNDLEPRLGRANLSIVRDICKAHAMLRPGDETMDKTEKLSLIDRFESAVEPLIDFVKSAPAQAIDFRPPLPGAWSIHDHAVHFLDADTFAYAR